MQLFFYVSSILTQPYNPLNLYHSNSHYHNIPSGLMPHHLSLLSFLHKQPRAGYIIFEIFICKHAITKKV